MTRIDDAFVAASLFRVKADPEELVDIVQFLQDGQAPTRLNENKKKIITIKVFPYTLINGYLYKLGKDDVLHRCVLEHEK